MKRSLQILVLAATGFSSVALPQTDAPSKDTQTTASSKDDRISDQIRMKLATDADVKGGDLDVVVKDGAVVLKGKVPTDKAKHKAESLTKKVKGVKSIDNELVVGSKT